MIATLGIAMELALHAMEVMFLIPMANVSLIQLLLLHLKIHFVRHGKRIFVLHAQTGLILIQMESVKL